VSDTSVPFEEVEAEALCNSEVRQAYDELEPAYQVARLRILRGLTQEQLAQLVGTKQSSIARLESGRELPRLSFLQRVVEALGGRLIVTIEPCSTTSRQASHGAAGR
jgi:DNA-binding XRE family transcriptional regulator